MGLSSQLQQTVVKDTNIRPPVTIADSATVREAVKVMRSAGLGCVVVIDSDEKAVGMFTEGILRHGLNESPGILEESVKKRMVERLPWVSPTESMSVVLEAMEENNIRFLAILDKDRRVIGITGQKTLMEFVADTFPREILTQDPTSATISRQKEGA